MSDLDNIKFNLTPEMADKIVKINDLKVKIYEIDNKIIDVNDIDLANERKKIIKKIECLKKDFIKDFQSSNRKQIDEYLSIRNKKN